MVRGEDNVGGRRDKGPSSTSSKDVPSLVDTTRVIMWLRPVREPQVDAFWKKFSFPSNVWVYFSSSGPHFINCTEEDRGGINFIY